MPLHVSQSLPEITASRSGYKSSPSLMSGHQPSVSSSGLGSHSATTSRTFPQSSKRGKNPAHGRQQTHTQQVGLNSISRITAHDMYRDESWIVKLLAIPVGCCQPLQRRNKFKARVRFAVFLHPLHPYKASGTVPYSARSAYSCLA